MTNLTQQERDAIVEYLFSCDIAFLVENLMDALPENELKALGQRLVADLEDEQTEIDSISSEIREGIYTNAMHLAGYLRRAGMNTQANAVETFGIHHRKG